MMKRVIAGMCATAGAVALVAVARVSVLAQTSGKTPTISKQAILDSVAKRVLLPAYTNFTARCAELSAAADALTSAPSLATVKSTQQAWTASLLAWRRTQAFVHGPIEDLGVYGRVQFWPARRQTIDRVLRADRPIDDAYIQELGATAVGLSAVEVMLFDPRQNDQARVAAFTGPKAARQRQYFIAVVRELHRKAQVVERAWQGPTGYAMTFGAGGQQQLNLLVNDILNAVETGAQARLQLVVERHDEPQFRSELVEGAPSGSSQQALLALLLGARAAYSGSDGLGVDDYLKSLNPGTAARVDAQFQKAIAAVRALDGPLEDAVGNRPRAIQQAYDDCRTLEILMKVEVASTLGVTLTFKSKDGD
jgi:predicted lipoprotein